MYKDRNSQSRDRADATICCQQDNERYLSSVPCQTEGSYDCDPPRRTCCMHVHSVLTPFRESEHTYFLHTQGSDIPTLYPQPPLSNSPAEPPKAQRQSCITGDRAMHFLLRTARRRPRPPFASAWGTNKATSIFPAAAPAAPAPAPAAATTTRKITSTRRRWSSSGFAAGDHAGAAAEMPSLPSAFPWREAPDKMNVRGLVERAMHSYLQHQHRRFLRAASRLNDADDETFLVSLGFRGSSQKERLADGYRTCVPISSLRRCY